MTDIREQKPRRKSARPFLAGDIPMQHEVVVSCPYCGESFSTIIDGSAGMQRYFEDCEVCCRPIAFHIETDWEGNLLMVDTAREDD